MRISSSRSGLFSKNLKNSKIYLNKKQVRAEIEKERETQTGVSSNIINSLLSNFPHFIGCFAQDHLQTLIIRSLPVSLIVNFDNSTVSGSHWVAIRIDRNVLDIFDPLGFNIDRWPKIPHFLLQFLHKFSQHRRVRISKEIQPINSSLCGFYCIFFVYFRLSHTFHACAEKFSRTDFSKNDKILYNIFKNKS